MVLGVEGAFLSSDSKDALRARFFMGATPRRKIRIKVDLLLGFAWVICTARALGCAEHRSQRGPIEHLTT
jgi:hypothetical protein